MSIISRLSENKRARQRLWWGAYVATSAAATVTGALGMRTAAGVTKPIPMALFGIRVVEHPDLSRLDRILIGGAVVASAVGDVWMWREEFADDEASKDRNLQIGAASFGVAQAFYSAAMVQAGARWSTRAFLPRFAAMGEPAALLAKFRPALLPVLGTYGNALATMSALASTTGSPQLTAGGLVFQASDGAILNRRFLLPADQPGKAVARTAVEAWVLGSYFTAQALLLDGLLRRS